MDAVTYPQEKIVAFVTDNFVPVRLHTDEHPELTKKYRIPWTPTVLVLDADGTEHYRETGYLPPEDFVAHLTLALGRTALEERDFAAAAKHFQTVADQFGSSETVPEALFFLGVCKNRLPGGKMDDRKAVWKRILEQHPKSDWAKKAGFAFE
jgi:hypothetical protein